MLESDLISIIMPAYNSENYIAESIESALQQSYQNWELLVVNDNSQDKTVDLIESYVKKDKRVRLLHNQLGQGVSGARNYGLQNAKGRYIAFLDSDDLWLPKKLEAQMEFMQSQQVDLCYTSFERINEKGEVISKTVEAPEETTFRELLSHNTIPILTVLVDAQRAGSLWFKSTGHEDYLLWLRLLKAGCRARGLNQKLARYRVVSGSRSRNKVRSLSWLWNIYKNELKLNYLQSLYLMLLICIKVVFKRVRFSK